MLRGGEPKGVSTQASWPELTELHREPLHQQWALCPPQRRGSSSVHWSPIRSDVRKVRPDSVQAGVREGGREEERREGERERRGGTEGRRKRGRGEGRGGKGGEGRERKEGGRGSRGKGRGRGGERRERGEEGEGREGSEGKEVGRRQPWADAPVRRLCCPPGPHLSFLSSSSSMCKATQ